MVSAVTPKVPGMDDWLVREFTLLGIPFQNWVVVVLAAIMIAVLMAKGEKR